MMHARTPLTHKPDQAALWWAAFVVGLLCLGALVACLVV